LVTLKDPVTKQQLTETQWFLGVSAKDGSYPDDALLMHLLDGLGCREIEPLGHGTAQARIPVEWADEVERDGHFSTAFAFGAVCGARTVWIVDVDLP
jgi:hypothetical protein